MTNEQIQRIYNAKMRNIMQKNARREKEQDDADRLALQKRNKLYGDISASLSIAGMGKDLREWRQSKLTDITYGDDTYASGALPKKYKFKEDRSFEDFRKDPLGELGESVKRLTPKGALEETEGYKQHKGKMEALKESREQARDIVPVSEELAVDEPIAYERLEQAEDVWTPPTAPAPLDMAALDESVKRSLYDRYYQDQASSGLSGMPKLSYEEWSEGVESGDLSAIYAEDARVHMGLGRYEKLTVPPESPVVPVETEDEFYTPTEKIIEGDDLPSPAPQPDYAKIQGAAEDQKLQALRELETTPGVAPEVSADPKLEKALGDLEKLKAPKVKGSDKVLPEQLRASVGMSDVPDVEAPITDVEVPDAKPGGRYVGKTLNALQTGQQMLNIGKTLTNEEASGADKALAGTQGVKMLADMAAKKAGQKTAVEAVKAGTKIGGKAAVGAAAGGVIGGYTMVTEAGEAKESWEEGDYDEAILHGISSVSGGLQTAGAGMMLTGIGAPLGAVLYGVGTAASVISSGAQLLEGLFGGSDTPALPEIQKPKFNAGRYIASLRDNRRYGY